MEWLWFLPINAPLALGGYWLARDGFGQRSGFPLAIATALLAWCGAVLGVIALGSCGAFRAPMLLAWSAGFALLGAACRWARRRGDPEPPAPKVPASPWEPEAVIVLGCTLLAVLLLGMPSLLGPVEVRSDGPIYHLYFAVRWWKEHRLSLIPVEFGETAATYFPGGGDCWFAWLIATWGGDLWAKVGQLPGLLLAAVIVYAAARRLGATSSASLLATCAFVSASHLLFYSTQANVDSLFIAFYLAGLYSLMRFALGDDGAASLALSGLAIGAALSTKPTSVLFVPFLMAAGLIAILARPRRLGNLATFLLTPLVMAGYWWGRNFWLTGNPIYPAHVQIGGFTVLQGWYTHEAMDNSRYYAPIGDWRTAIDMLLAMIDPRLFPLWLASVLGLWGLGRRPPSSRLWAWAWALLALINLAAFWLLVPYRTQARLAYQAIGLMAVPLAILLNQGRWLRIIGAFLLMVHLWTMQSWPLGSTQADIPWDLNPKVPNAVAPPISLPIPALGMTASERDIEPRWIAQVLLGVLTILAMATAWAWNRARGPNGGRWRVVMALILAGATIGLLGVRTYPWGRDPDLTFYPHFQGFVKGWTAWERVSRDRPRRVAYAGTNLPYYLMGRGYRNDVRYVSIDERRDWLMHDYHRAAALADPRMALWPYPRPGWDRLRPDYDAWLANLRAEGIDYLVLAKPGPDEGLFNIYNGNEDLIAGGFTIEAAWAASHPEAFKLLHGEDDPEMWIYEVLPAR